MRLTHPLALASLASLTTACVIGDETTDESDSEVRVDPTRDGTEPAFIDGRQCTMVFPGGLTESTQTYAIWDVGTNGIVNQPYNTPQRPNIYAVFGTAAPASQVHHVDGFDQFDHYHILDGRVRHGEVDNSRWDLLTAWPGPNFPATGYVSAKSVAEMNAQVAAGVLKILTLPEAGFPPVVLYSPIKCR
jgi:hypothetical protein